MNDDPILLNVVTVLSKSFNEWISTSSMSQEAKNVIVNIFSFCTTLIAIIGENLIKAFTAIERFFTQIKPESMVFFYDVTRWCLYIVVIFLVISMLKWMYEKGYSSGTTDGYIEGANDTIKHSKLIRRGGSIGTLKIQNR